MGARREAHEALAAAGTGRASAGAALSSVILRWRSGSSMRRLSHRSIVLEIGPGLAPSPTSSLPAARLYWSRSTAV